MASKETHSGTSAGADSTRNGNHGPAGSPANQARDKAIDLALAAIDKQFGKGAIMRLGKDPIDREVHVIPTGSLRLHLALGLGGAARRRRGGGFRAGAA